MANEKKENVEREYVIPLRSKFQHVPRYKKTNKAVKTVKEFLTRHMKIYDRDLNKIRLSTYVNEFLWARGIKNPPHKIKVKAKKEGDIVRVELAEFPTKLKFKKERADKQSKKALEAIEKKKSLMDKAKESLKAPEKEEKKDGVEEKVEIEEKKDAVKEAGAKLEKDLAKKTKHQTGGKTTQPKRPQRKALAK